MEQNSKNTESSSHIAEKLTHILRVVYYMLRKTMSKRKLMMDLNSLLKQSKLAGKAISKLLTHHHHHSSTHHHRSSSSSSSSFSCLSMDPARSVYNPGQEVEFSCTDTPLKRKNHRKNHAYNYETATAIANAFEMLNKNYNVQDAQTDDDQSVLPSPSPLILGFGKSPRMVRQLRITDSPFPVEEDDRLRDGKVDKEADDFIRRFYQQLQMQKATPEYNFRRG